LVKSLRVLDDHAATLSDLEAFLLVPPDQHVDVLHRSA